MKKSFLKKLFSWRVWLLTPILGFGLLCLGLRFGLATPFVNHWFKEGPSKTLGLTLNFGSVRTNFKAWIELRDVVLMAGPKGQKRPLLTLKRAHLRYRFFELWNSGFHLEEAVQSLVLSGLKVFVLRDTEGVWNWSAVIPAKDNNNNKALFGDAGTASYLAFLAGRLALQDGTVVFADETRKFYSTLKNVHGSADARALPLVTLALTARTDDQPRDNLSLTADWRVDKESLLLRTNLQKVPLKRYFNYGLPDGGVAFDRGHGDLNLKFVFEEGQPDLRGSARLRAASLLVPGVSQPLSNLNGELEFHGNQLHLHRATADFLGSRWKASGNSTGLKNPVLNLSVTNAALNLARVATGIYQASGFDLTGLAAVSVTVKGNAAGPEISGVLSSERISIYGLPLEKIQASVVSKGKRLQLKNISGKLAQGQFKAAGDFYFPRWKGDAGKLQANLTLKHSDLAAFSLGGVKVSPLQGTASASFKLGGSAASPRIRASLLSEDAAMGAMPVGPLTLACDFNKSELYLSFQSAAQPIAGEVALTFGKKIYFQNSKISVDGVKLEDFLQGVRGVPKNIFSPKALRRAAKFCNEGCQGELNFNLALKGHLNNPEVSLDTNIPHVKIHPPRKSQWRMDKAKNHFVLGLVGKAVLKDKMLRLGSGGPLRILLEGHGDRGGIDLKGEYPLSADGLKKVVQPLRLILRGDLKMLQELKLVDESKGPFNGDLVLEGYADQPRPRGWLALGIKRLKLKRWLRPVDEGNFKLVLADGKVLLQDAYLLGNKPSAYRMDIDADLDFSAGPLPVGSVTASGGEGQALALFKLPGIRKLGLGLNPLKIEFGGGARPIKVSGSVSLADGLLVLGQSASKETKEKSRSAFSLEKTPVVFDLKFFLKDNIRLEKPSYTRLTKNVLSNLLHSIKAGLLDPALTVQLRSNRQEILLRGTLLEPQARGALEIIQGNLVLLGRNFKIKSGKVELKKGLRADIKATAQTIVYESRGDGEAPLPVRIKVEVKPHSEQELARLGLEDTLVNFGLSQDSFSSDTDKSNQALLSLLVLGADLSVQNGGADEGGRQDALVGVAFSRMFEVAWAGLVSLLPPSLRSRSKSVLRLDYFRVFPRFNRNNAVANTAADGKDSALKNQFINTDIVMDAGLSIFDWMFFRGEAVQFADTTAVSTAISDNEADALAARGGKLGLEIYHKGWTLEGKMNINVDENLEALPLNTRSGYVGLRNTVHNQSYSSAQALRRRWSGDKVHSSAAGQN